MALTPFLIVLYGFAVLCALIALGHGAGARRHWRARRRFRAGTRALWSLVFVLLALLGAVGGTALLGFRRLASEALVADIDTRQLGPQRFAIDIALPDDEPSGIGDVLDKLEQYDASTALDDWDAREAWQDFWRINYTK